jgi:hypothetical protein
MNVVYLKLITGEDIVSYSEGVDEEYVYLYNPICFHTVNTNRGAMVRSTKWIPFTDHNDFSVRIRDILILSTPTKDIEEQYFKSLDVLDENSLQEGFDEEQVKAFYELYSNTSIKVH